MTEVDARIGVQLKLQQGGGNYYLLFDHPHNNETGDGEWFFGRFYWPAKAKLFGGVHFFRKELATGVFLLEVMPSNAVHDPDEEWCGKIYYEEMILIARGYNIEPVDHQACMPAFRGKDSFVMVGSDKPHLLPAQRPFVQRFLLVDPAVADRREAAEISNQVKVGQYGLDRSLEAVRFGAGEVPAITAMPSGAAFYDRKKKEADTLLEAYGSGLSMNGKASVYQKATGPFHVLGEQRGWAEGGEHITPVDDGVAPSPYASRASRLRSAMSAARMDVLSFRPDGTPSEPADFAGSDGRLPFTVNGGVGKDDRIPYFKKGRRDAPWNQGTCSYEAELLADERFDLQHFDRASAGLNFQCEFVGSPWASFFWWCLAAHVRMCRPEISDTAVWNQDLDLTSLRDSYTMSQKHGAGVVGEGGRETAWGELVTSAEAWKYAPSLFRLRNADWIALVVENTIAQTLSNGMPMRRKMRGGRPDDERVKSQNWDTDMWRKEDDDGLVMPEHYHACKTFEVPLIAWGWYCLARQGFRPVALRSMIVNAADYMRSGFKKHKDPTRSGPAYGMAVAESGSSGSFLSPPAEGCWYYGEVINSLNLYAMAWEITRDLKYLDACRTIWGFYNGAFDRFRNSLWSRDLSANQTLSTWLPHFAILDNMLSGNYKRREAYDPVETDNERPPASDSTPPREDPPSETDNNDDDLVSLPGVDGPTYDEMARAHEAEIARLKDELASEREVNAELRGQLQAIRRIVQ